MRSTVLAILALSVLSLLATSLIASRSVAAPVGERTLSGAVVRSATKEVVLDRDGAVWIEREVHRARVESTVGHPEGDPDLWLTLRHGDGSEERYRVHGKNRLYDQKLGLSYRFYMAYSLAETVASTGQAAKGPPPGEVPLEAGKSFVPPKPEVPVEAVLRLTTDESVTVALDADERLELALELRRVLSFATPGSYESGGLVGVADAKLLVRYADGREERYALFSGSVLHDENAGRVAQFYMATYLRQKVAAAARARAR